MYFPCVYFWNTKMYILLQNHYVLAVLHDFFVLEYLLSPHLLGLFPGRKLATYILVLNHFHCLQRFSWRLHRCLTVRTSEICYLMSIYSSHPVVSVSVHHSITLQRVQAYRLDILVLLFLLAFRSKVTAHRSWFIFSNPWLQPLLLSHLSHYVPSPSLLSNCCCLPADHPSLIQLLDELP